MQVFNNPTAEKYKDLCNRPAMDLTELEPFVGRVFAEVKVGGDKVVNRYSEKFDDISQFRTISADEIRKTAAKISGSLKRSLDQAYDNIYKFHVEQAKGSPAPRTDDETCWQESRAIQSVGLYVPSGLVSSLLMLGVPAQIAKNKTVTVCTPPNKESSISPAMCYAATLVGVTEIFVVGGIQAIAAMTYGTETIPMVDKIFGPGNQYVNAAKLYAQKNGVAIDMPAGPSEVMVLADSSANPAYVAADLLSQAEHGPDSQVVLVTNSDSIVDEVQSELNVQIGKLPRKEIVEKTLYNSFAVVLESVESMIAFSNSYAPEHLILSVKNADSYIIEIINAGSVFLGNYSPESAGDYATGTNHTLPTAGAARAYSGITVQSFCKTISFQKISKTGLNKLRKTIEILAEEEGLQANANAVSIRFSDNIK
jgi:histidinol dehydrogenase